MGTFATKKILPGNPSLIPAIAEQIRTEFMAEQFEVQIDNLLSGGVDISISKGNLFKAVLGLKSALKVSLIPKDNAIAFEAGIGIFGQQAIPTIISMLFFWPVLITQIWGMVQQSKLDDKALEIAEVMIRNQSSSTISASNTGGWCFVRTAGIGISKVRNSVRNVERRCRKDYKNNKGKIIDNSIVLMKMT